MQCAILFLSLRFSGARILRRVSIDNCLGWKRTKNIYSLINFVYCSYCASFSISWEAGTPMRLFESYAVLCCYDLTLNGVGETLIWYLRASKTWEVHTVVTARELSIRANEIMCKCVWCSSEDVLKKLKIFRCFLFIERCVIVEVV